MVRMNFDCIFKVAKISHNVFLVFILFCIDLYQEELSFLFPDSCKYYPTCSEFTKQSLKKHGILKGGFFSILRIIRCNPFCCGGIDLPN